MADPRPMSYYSNLIGSSSYNETRKTRWLKEGTALLKQAAKDLELAPGSYSVRTCVGGIAVPGDVILHHDVFYVSLGTEPGMGIGIGYARTCAGRKDYGGNMENYNRWVSASWTYDKLLQLLRETLADGHRMAARAS